MTIIKNPKIYHQLSIDKRRIFKKGMDSIMQMTKLEIEHFENLTTKPLKDRIQAVQDVLANKITLQQFELRLIAINKHIKRIFLRTAAGINQDKRIMKGESR